MKNEIKKENMKRCSHKETDFDCIECLFELENKYDNVRSLCLYKFINDTGGL